MFYKKFSKFSGNGNDENPFLLSFSDLMASLLAIFILVLVVTLVQLEKRKEELRVSKYQLIDNLKEIQQIQNGIADTLNVIVNREQSLATMLIEIQNDLRKDGIEVMIAENYSVLRIPEKELNFALGRYDIPPAFSAQVNTIGMILLKALSNTRNRSLLDTVFVEGHTDSVTNNREMGNWGLSTYRAISLWNFWTEAPGQVAELKQLQTVPHDPSQHPKPLISVSGYADTRSTHGLLDGKGLKDDRSEDRRIDIRFTLVSSEKNKLKQLENDIENMKTKMGEIIGNL